MTKPNYEPGRVYPAGPRPSPRLILSPRFVQWLGKIQFENYRGAVVASDALLTLRAAVDEPIAPMLCPEKNPRYGDDVTGLGHADNVRRLEKIGHSRS